MERDDQDGPALQRALAQLADRSDRDRVTEGMNQLASLAASGQPEALRALLRSTLDLRLAERVVRTVLLDPADVDDAVQATLIAVAESIGRFEGRSSYSTWVNRVAKNQAIDVLRRHQRLSEPATNEVPEVDNSARRLSSLIADQHRLAEALGHLTPEHREIVELREQQGLSYEEIAAQLGLALGTVRSRINRARAQLAQLLLADSARPT